MKTSFGFILGMLFCLATVSYPGTKTFTREYTYIAGEADSKITARAIALEQVKRHLLEEVGVYIHSQFEVEKWEKIIGATSQLGESTKTRIQAITAGITKTSILEERWTGDRYYMRAEIVVDPDDVLRRVSAIVEDESKLAGLEESRRRADSALVEINRLQEELRFARTEGKKTKTEEAYRIETDHLSAIDWFERGNAKGIGEPYAAVADYTEAIQLKPNFAEAYRERGLIKYFLGDKYGAVADYTKAIGLKADFSGAYYNRGRAKASSEDYSGAIADYTKAIDLAPKWGNIYYHRGVARYFSKDDYGAISDLTKAFEFGVVDAFAYAIRGAVKAGLGDNRSAIDDFTKAITIEPDLASAYLDRARSEFGLGQVEAGCADLKRAADLGNESAVEELRERCN